MKHTRLAAIVMVAIMAVLIVSAAGVIETKKVAALTPTKMSFAVSKARVVPGERFTLYGGLACSAGPVRYKPIAISVQHNGKSVGVIHRTTDANGRFSWSSSYNAQTGLGTWAYTARFAGDRTYGPSAARVAMSCAASVHKISTSLTLKLTGLTYYDTVGHLDNTPGDIPGWGYLATVTGTLTDFNGKGIPGKLIVVRWQGLAHYPNGSTRTQHYAQNMQTLADGTYTFKSSVYLIYPKINDYIETHDWQASFAGDSVYGPSSSAILQSPYTPTT